MRLERAIIGLACADRVSSTCPNPGISLSSPSAVGIKVTVKGVGDAGDVGVVSSLEVVVDLVAVARLLLLLLLFLFDLPLSLDLDC